MKKLARDWVFFADRDLQTAEIITKDEYPLTNIVTFHCQQAIEKYLKAYLADNAVPIIKTHDLIKLNNMIKEIKDMGIDEKKLIIINEVYAETRYPGDLGLLPDGLPSDKQALEFVEYAREIRDIISRELVK